MNVFDFDNTLYHGESAVDFALFLIKYNRKIILWLPKIFWNLLKYKLCLIKRDNMEAQLDRFMQSCLPAPDELRVLVKRFWKCHRHKLDAGIIRRITPEDAIISAGPYFLLRPIQKHLGTSNLICSEVDIARKSVVFLNFGGHKVIQYRGQYGSTPIDDFYSDSYNDLAMMDIAKRVFLVKKGKIKRIR